MNETRRKRQSWKGLALFALSLVASAGSALAQEEESLQFRTAFPIRALRNASPTDAKVAASVLLKRIVHQQGYKHYTTDVPETREEFVAGLRAGSYDFVLIETLDYLALKEEFPMQPRIAGAAIDADPMETFLLLVREGAAEEGLAGLKGKRLLIERGGQSLSSLWLETLMAEKGLKGAGEHFGEITTVGNCADGALPVFFGKADACLITKSGFDVMTELNPQLSRRLTATNWSEPLLISMMCLREGFVERIPGQLEDVSMRLHESSDGQQILNMMRVKRLLVWEDRFLDPVKRLVAKHHLLIGGDNAPTTENSIATKDASSTAMPVEAAENNPATTGVEENDQP